MALVGELREHGDARPVEMREDQQRAVRRKRGKGDNLGHEDA